MNWQHSRSGSSTHPNSRSCIGFLPKHRWSPVLTVAYVCVFAFSVQHFDAAAQSWRSVGPNTYREVRMDSIFVNWPRVTYELRELPLSTGGTSNHRMVEAMCDSRARRQAYPGLPFDGRFLGREEQSHYQRVEVDLVCEHVIASQSPRRVPSPDPPPEASSMSSGSGFIISGGKFVTNHHVVDGCRSLSVRFGELQVSVKVTAATARNDLALLSAEQTFGTPVEVRATAALGEDVTVSGFPLSGLLSSDLIVTSGQVNSLAGLGNDPTMLQISAPVQPGNSGGPLLDRSGSVVGVVVSKLNVEKLAKLTGDMAQNVNFAIKPEVLRLFLDTNRVQYRTAPLGQRLDGIVLAERARQLTVQVLCEK